MSYRRNNGSGLHVNNRDMESFYEAMLDYKLNTPSVPVPFYALKFPRDYYGMYGDYTDEESDDDDDDTSRQTYCGFQNRFLNRDFPKQTSLHQPPLTQPVFRLNKGVTVNKQEEADRIAKELADEEKKMKDKAEKKKQKKMRQKERKRLEKLKENENTVQNTNIPESSSANTSTVKPSASESRADTYSLSDKTCGVSPDTEPSSQGATAASVPVRCTGLGEESSVPAEDDDNSMIDELEDLDMTSCFVSNVRHKWEQKPKLEKKERKKNAGKHEPQAGAQQNGTVSETEQVFATSMKLGEVANKMAETGDFETAVNYFTDAVKYNPTDYRLYGNRSFCYEKLQEYDKALADALVSLSLKKNWIKGLYRKGKALVGLKRYSEAALAFQEILKQDSCRSEAVHELIEVQKMHLMSMGFSEEHSKNALMIYGSVEKAVEVLSVIPEAMQSSPSVEEEWVVSEKKKSSSASKNVAKPKASAKTSPARSQRQLELFPVWVGNLIPSISEAKICEIFSTIGEIHNVRLLRDRRCAFINYSRKEHCESAIKQLNGMVLDGAILTVRYPDRIHTHLGVSKTAVTAGNVPSAPGPKMAGECFLWRSAGCPLKNCIFKHIPEHKGIDRGREKATT